MGENELDIKTGAMYYREDVQGAVYKLLMPITEAPVIEQLPYVDDIKVFVPDVHGSFEGEITTIGPMDISNDDEHYWFGRRYANMLRLAVYRAFGGTDRRRIKRFKRRNRRYEIRMKIAKTRGQV